MAQMAKRVILCMLVVLLIASGMFFMDRERFRNSLIRFHVVANSDSESDQEVKLLVRDAVLQSIQEDLGNVADVKQAKAYLQENLPKIEDLANAVLKAAGFEDKAAVSLCKESFPVREYDTFTLPSGVYEALRIVIGEGEGHNWWCVSFPTLCLPATAQGFVETAMQTGSPEYLAKSLSNDGQYNIHFYLMDVIGRIENSFFQQG